MSEKLSERISKAINEPVFHGDWSEWLAELRELEAKNAQLQAEYWDLIGEVINKIPGENRHETAKRIIHEHENRGGEQPHAVWEDEHDRAYVDGVDDQIFETWEADDAR